MKKIRIVSVELNPGKHTASLATTTFELEVVPALCNPMNNMHGGAVATLGKSKGSKPHMRHAGTTANTLLLG